MGHPTRVCSKVVALVTPCKLPVNRQPPRLGKKTLNVSRRLIHKDIPHPNKVCHEKSLSITNR
eukprot:jgi/Botrbrau1/17472/Bobra.0054s0059.1